MNDIFGIVGFRRYSYNIRLNILFINKTGKQIKLSRGHYNMIDDDGVKKHIPADRVLYCVKNSVDPRTMKFTSIIDGHVVPRKEKSRKTKSWWNNYDDDLEIAEKCIRLQKEFVNTGNIQPILMYIASFSDGVREWACKRNNSYSCTYKIDIEEVLSQAFLRIAESIDKRQQPCIHPRMMLMSCVKSIVIQQYKEHKRKTELNENIRYSKL